MPLESIYFPLDTGDGVGFDTSQPMDLFYQPKQKHKDQKLIQFKIVNLVN